ncbi:hypothetical protein E1176_07250 [Fulvivirga sp. RKSG066]|uniref:hypothetical protein n=1 Tax=Fulvivirga aurantia TaxID=2529383 RepID=UPI0012BCDE37|nr:hypothetical protein [Fulvivirga aurantia]MTI20811.1 hypothetical protein [Fulvivirga aurantia]
MQKVSIYKGIEYIRISQLPKEERDQIRNWLNIDTIIKIQTETELIPDGVVYKNYVHWYENIYTKISPAEVATESKAAKAKASTKPYSGLAFE